MDPPLEDDDAALRYAIALSLEDSNEGQAQPQNPIELSSDDEDALGEAPAEGRKNQNTDEPSPRHPSALPPPPATGLAALGIDRKRMEEERLTRLAKRKTLDDDQGSEDQSSKFLKTYSSLRLKSGSSTPPAMANESIKNAASASGAISAFTAGQGLQFPCGAVKKTWAYGYPRTGDDIKIEEVLQKKDLELAVLSSFQWDDTWLMSKINLRKTKLILVAYASSKQQQDEMRANIPTGSQIRFCFPPMSSFGNMHSKLQILKFSSYLRIVVPSGNLVSYDWGESGVIENIVFLIDLPRLEDPAARAANKLTSFGEELSYFLTCKGLDDDLVTSLKNYDFSSTAHYAFVHTIGKTHEGDSWKRTGYCGLGRAVSELGMATDSSVEIDLVVSSLGSIKQDLLKSIYYAAQGDNGQKELNERSSKQNSTDFKDRIRIYFPSHETVAQSRGGLKSGGTICAQSKWWSGNEFPRHLIHDAKSTRKGLLSHGKIMLVRHCKPSGTGPSAWGYVGSANLSESAWGRLTKDRQTKSPKLTCRNWECGVLVPIPRSVDVTEQPPVGQSTPIGLNIFCEHIPIPLAMPAQAFEQSGYSRPWLFLEN